MRRVTITAPALASLSMLIPMMVGPVLAADPPAPRASIAEQQRAMEALAGFEGTWRGPARTTTASGRTMTLTQTERFGRKLDGTIRVVEGRGYDDDGTLVFNAFGIMSYMPETKAYHFRSYAQGHGADLPIEISQDRFVWTLSLGPRTIRYTATVRDGVWHEVGERLVDGREPVVVHDMTLRRVGDSDWPAGGAVPMR